MHWKALDRAMNLSEVPAPGDASLQAILERSLKGRRARSGLDDGVELVYNTVPTVFHQLN